MPNGASARTIPATPAGYAKANTAYWAQRSASYRTQHQEELADAHNAAWTRELQGQLQRVFGLTDGLEVLDIGCGPGFTSIILARLGCSVTAIDYTPAMLEAARANACACGQHVRFVHMDAQDLRFADASFSAVVSRNLTWNLPRPSAAYREWARVLRPGGLLLNYDANWYGYLTDADLRDAWEADRVRARAQHVEDCTLRGGNAKAMEAIAASAPASYLQRPAWDIATLEGLGLSATADAQVAKRVWSRAELLSQASTPLFRIHARKDRPQE